VRRLACPEGDLSAADAGALRASLEAGELLIYPTDTLYALGGLVLMAGAAGRVRAAKGREEQKPLPAVAADLEQVRRLCAALSPRALAMAEAFWPGPLTLVLPASPDVPGDVTRGATLAVRVPDRELTRALCRLAGPLVSTSANLAGGRAPSTCEEAVAAVGSAAAWVLDAGPGASLPSTIVDVTTDTPLLVRAGAIPWEDVQRFC
jgi:L-threonylcarbamoyladenylate synthase